MTRKAAPRWSGLCPSDTRVARRIHSPSPRGNAKSWWHFTLARSPRGGIPPASREAMGQATVPSGQAVPIQFGSRGFRQLEVGPFQITHVRLSALATIEPHYHERPNLGVMLQGSFDLGFRGSRTAACTSGYLFIEPAGETHCNCMGCQGARVLALQPDPAMLQALLPRSGFLATPAVTRIPSVTLLARRLARELASPDPFSALLVEGLAAELLALAGRTASWSDRRGRDPVWLQEIEAELETALPGRKSLLEHARRAGVHVTQLNRQFRNRFGKSAGRYLLDRRLEWAAAELAADTRSLAEIACQAGFADQSHFTRRFREYTGRTPQQHRRVAGAGRTPWRGPAKPPTA